MRWTLIGKVVGDVILVNGGYLVAFLLRFGGDLPHTNWDAYWATAPWITAAALVLFYSYGLYTPGRYHWEEIFSSLIAAMAILFLASIAFSFMLHQFAFPRSVFLIAAPIQLLLLCLWRRFAWAWSMSRMGPLKLLVVGSFSRAKERAKQLAQSSGNIYQVTGLVVDVPVTPGSNNDEGFQLLGSYAEMAAVIDSVTVNGVLFCADVPWETRVALVSEATARGLSVFIVPEIYEIMLSQSRLEQLDGIPVFRLTGIASKPSFTWKRLTDIVLALVFAVPAIPLLLLSAIAIKLESPHGPVLFRQKRVGHGGKIFELLKLRTMVPDAEKLTGPVLATERDPRITKVGYVLRATRIDELPQLWNVLKGDMSFVGPRPERPFFVEQFRKEVPGYDYRHQIKVGITGLAQVEGKYSTSAEDKLRYDLLYAKTKSPVKDLHILLQTLKVMLMRGKAS